MWKKKIKKKKTQFILVGATLFVIATILSMCLSFTLELKSFSQKSLTKENCPDAFIVATGSKELSENITDQDTRDLIKNESAITGKELSVPILFHDNSISLYYQMMLSAKNYEDWGYIWLSEGNEEEPSVNEVWIAKKIAVSQGIQLGDTITLAYEKPVTLTVSGIYKAGFAPSVSNAFAPIMVSDELIKQYSYEPDSAIFSINMKDYSIENCHKILDNYSFGRQILTRDKLQNQVVVFASLISGFSIIAVLIVFLLALVVIRYIVKNNITREFKDIGIYKSLGYKSKQIKQFYLKGYAVIGLIAILLGTVCSFPLNYALGQICTKCLDGYRVTSLSVLCAVFVTIILLGILVLNVKFALRRVDGITPIQAIAVGVTMHEGKITKSVIRHAKSPFEMAINDIFKNKKTSMVIVSVFTLSLCLCMLFSKMIYTFSHAEAVASKWFAIPQNSLYLTGNMSDEIFEYVDQNELVKSEVHGTMSYALEVTSNQVQDVSLREVKFDIFHDTDETKTGVPMVKGENPCGNDEIAVTETLAKMLKVNPGDYIRLSINGMEKEYLITGTYFSLFSQQGIMITEDAIKLVDPAYHTLMGFVTLNNAIDFDEFKSDMTQRFDSISVDKEWFTMENSISTIKSMVVIVSSILIVVFFLFFLINTLIVLLMENTNKRFSYGVLKSLGFTSGYLRRQNMIKFLLLAGISCMLALVIHLNVADIILSKIVLDGFLDSGWIIGMIDVIFIGFVMAINFIIGRSINKVTVVELTEE